VKIICKAMVLSCLVIALTSCNTFAAKPTETQIPIATSLPTSTSTPEPTITLSPQQTATSVAPTQTPSVAVTVDRHNPESVLRAYFDAWERSDWSVQVSLMDEKYAQMAPEPVDSISILEIQPIASSSLTARIYLVIFEIKVKGQGISMQSGRYDWNYYLTWDAKRGSWFITNYGSG
jgi:hypothetical protein